MLYIYRKDRVLFYISLTICIIILLLFIFINTYQDYLIKNYRGIITGKVINIELKQYYQKITISYKTFKVNILDYSFNNIKIGDIIKVEGKKQIIDINHIPFAFNYEKYFYNNRYILEIKSNQISVIKHSFSIYQISELVNKYLAFFFDNEALVIMKGFIIGDTSSFDPSFNNELQINGIIHLFAISGSHIVLIISFLEKVLNKVKSKFKIINVFLIIYLIITKFSISITRAVLTYLITQFIKNKNITLSSLDISSIVFILLIIINPFFMYNLGFILSFFSTFLIILISDYLTKISNIKSILIITLMINLFTFPLMININNEYNILSPIINIIMILLVEGILIPLSFIVLVFPIFNIGYTYIVSAFMTLNKLIADISFKLGFVIVVKEMSNSLSFIYYLIIILIIVYFKNKKLRVRLISLFVIILILSISNIKTYFTSPTITFLDLYNGEATLIEYKNETILIDTGEGINNEVTTFLKAKGIRKIDYIFITHNHSDHNGELKNILLNFKVTNLVLNAYDNSEFAKLANVIFLKQGMVLNTKNIQFNCLFPNYYSDNENNNSLVLYFLIEDVSFLFTGDIEKEIENQFINMDVDVLKIAHHGSNTSSDISFLKKVNPSYCIIMNGRSNINQFPNISIVNNIKSLGIDLYYTKKHYTIILKIKKNKCIFETIK